jgi:hypothetical protein
MGEITSVHFFVLVLSGILLLVVVLIIGVLLYGFFQYRKSVRLSGWLENINQRISEAIVYDEQEQPDHHAFEQLTGNSSFRNLFLQKLVDSEKKFSGMAKDKIRDLFNRYGLRHEAEQKLDRKKAFLIAAGIQELTVMDSRDALPGISGFLLHPSPQVYQEAQYAMVSLKGFEGLNFLNTAKEKISEWQQLRLLFSVATIPENSLPAVRSWLMSSNDSVVVFTLKLIRKFQLLSFYPEVTGLLVHPSSEVRIRAVQTLVSLENPSTMTDFTEVYPHQPSEVQSEIIRAMKVSKDKNTTELLKKELSENPASGLKVHAAEALFSLGHHEYLVQLMRNEATSDELVQIVKYALQEKI